MPSPFGNRGRWPYWTGWSFDRCALLALIYPLFSLFAVCVWSSKGGTIGTTLGLETGVDWWWRMAAAITSFAAGFSVWRAVRSTGWRLLLWSAAIGVAFVGVLVSAFAVVGAVVGAVIGAVAVAVAVVGADAFVGAVAVAGAFVGADDFVEDVLFVGGVAFAGGVAFVGAVLFKKAATRDRMGSFWTKFWPLVIVIWFLGFEGVWRTGSSQTGLELLIMFGLVPILNMPFDWASLGFTRALLRWGCETDAPWPLWLGLVDFAIGLVLLLLLALALIAGLQAADAIAMAHGGEPVANVIALLDNIAKDPRDPANYWAYFTLFST